MTTLTILQHLLENLQATQQQKKAQWSASIEAVRTLRDPSLATIKRLDEARLDYLVCSAKVAGVKLAIDSIGNETEELAQASGL